MPDAKTIRAKLQAELARLKAENAPQEEIDAEVQAAQSVIDEISAQDPQQVGELSGAGKAVTALTSAFDSATLGLPSLAADAVVGKLSGRGFTAQRQTRKGAKESLYESNPKTALAFDVGGAILPSLLPGVGQANLARSVLGKAVTSAPKAASAGGVNVPVRKALAKLTGNAGDAVMQGAVAGGVGELGDDSGDSALSGAAKGAAGGLLGSAVGKVAGMGQRAAGRISETSRLDKQAVNLARRMKASGSINYGKALGAAPQPLNKELQILLQHEDIEPLVNKMLNREHRIGMSVNDPEFLDALYKEGLSDWGQQAERAIKEGVGDTSKPNASRDLIKHINGLKVRMLDALDKQMPGYKKAVTTHAIKKGEEKALYRGADVGQAIGGGKHIKGKKFLAETPAGFVESIPDMTKAEAEMAYAGILGRTGEQIRLSGNPLTTFNVIPSAVRVPLYMARNREVVRALEQKLGKKAVGRDTERVATGTLSRALGALAGR